MQLFAIWVMFLKYAVLRHIIVQSRLDRLGLCQL